MTEVTSQSQLPVLGPNEPLAPIAILSADKRSALIICLISGALHKRKGVWIAPSGSSENAICNTTVVDLSRDGMLVLDLVARSGLARLTPRGCWFARTLVSRAAELQRMSSI